MSKLPIDIQGIEYEWLATDCDGHVACFSTAGGGRVPLEFLRDTDAHDVAIDEIVAGPRSSSGQFAPGDESNGESLGLLLVERGLFLFESDYFGADYQLVATPTRPATLSEFPRSVSELIGRISFEKLCFTSVARVTNQDVSGIAQPLTT